MTDLEEYEKDYLERIAKTDEEKEADEFLSLYKAGLSGYTYLVDPDKPKKK